MKTHYLFLITISIFFNTISLAVEKPSFMHPFYSKYKNILVIAWDGVERTRLQPLLAQKKLPHLMKIVEKGRYSNLYINEGSSDTKPGFAQLLTGYDTTELGILSSKIYRPIPKDQTVFERLRNKFKDKINLFLISGKKNDLGARGLHKICLNCLEQDSKNHTFYNFSNEPFTAPTENDVPKEIVNREGEPFYFAKSSLDFYAEDIGSRDNVLKKTIDLLDQYKNKPFMGVINFQEPEEVGHLLGESSPDYPQAIIDNDQALGKIINKLEELNILNETILFIVSDHGFEKNGFKHNNAYESFLASNLKDIYPMIDRRDLTPTILELFDFKNEKIVPKLDGFSILTGGDLKHKVAIKPRKGLVRVGYFIGGRTILLFRAEIDKSYKKSGVELDFISRSDLSSQWMSITDETKISKNKKNNKDIKDSNFAKATGDELVDLLLRDDVDVATIGETAYVRAVADGLPIVAIAELGYDKKDASGHGILVSSRVKIKKPEDFKGLTFGARRSAGGDTIFLREFFSSIGIDPDKDIHIIDNLPDAALKDDIIAGRLDGVFFHLMSIVALAKRPHEMKQVTVYSPLNWVNSEMSQAIIVTTPKKLKEKRSDFKKMLRGYMKRIAYEHSLPKEHRMKRAGKMRRDIEMDVSFNTMNYPQYRDIPTIRKELLDEYQKLMVKHKRLTKEVDLSRSIDNSLVLEIAAELKLNKTKK